MEKLSKGRENGSIRRERNKYKRLYFKYVEERDKQICKADLQNIDQDYSTSRTNSLNQNDTNIINNASDNDDGDFLFDSDDYTDYSEEDYSEFSDEDSELPEDDSDFILDLNDKKIKDLIIVDLLNNLGKGRGARFLDETKIYAYELFCKSPSAYKFLSKLLQFPSESTLRRKFDKKVFLHKTALTNVSNLDSIFLNQKKIYSLKEEKIDVVLAVDAFAGTILKRLKDDENQNQNPNKHVFMFLFCPVLTKFKTFLGHLYPAQSGSANSMIDSLINQIKIKSSFSNFQIKYISIDGDAHYSKFFRAQFDNLFKLYKEKDMNEFNLLFEELLPLFSTDPLHIWKNIRTRLFHNIVINPFIPSNSVNASKINQVLQLGPILTDNSQVAKMQDDFAIGLFNFKNAFLLLQKYTKESFFLIFIVSLWVEALQNINLSPDCRIYLINVMLRIIAKIYSTLKENKLPLSVSFKKSAHNQFVTIFTIEKIERIFPTLLGMRYEICKYKNNKIISLGRYGTHCAENKIGNIRSLSSQDESVDNLINVAARYDYIKTLTKADDDPRKKRLSQGGVRLNMGNFDMPTDLPFEVIADFLLFEFGFINEFDKSLIDWKMFEQILENFIQNAPYDPKISYSSTKSHKIVDRYYSLPTYHDYVPIIAEKHIWTRDECDIIDSLLTTGREKEIYNIFRYIPNSSLTSYIQKRKTYLSLRPLQTPELYIFNALYNKGVNLKDIAAVLPCRTAQSLKYVLDFKTIF